MIAHLQKLSFGQVVRNDGPESHFSKRGTPTMGGIMILTAIVISVLWGLPVQSVRLVRVGGAGRLVLLALLMIIAKWCVKTPKG